MASFMLGLGGFNRGLLGQAECYSCGGLRGNPVEGDLMAWGGGISSVTNVASTFSVQSLKARLFSARISRNGNKLISAGGLTPGRAERCGSLINARITFKDTGPGLVSDEAKQQRLPVC